MLARMFYAPSWLVSCFRGFLWCVIIGSGWVILRLPQ